MEATTDNQLKLISVQAPLLRVLLVVPLALVIFGAWYAVRWYMGNTIASYAVDLDDGALDTARSAVSLAPDDPQTHWGMAVIEKQSFAPEELADAIKNYEQAVRSSPNDYRLWMDLGQARGAMGDAAGSEQALRRAVELAPSYASPQWYLGNALVRQGKLDEAFAHLRVASEQNSEMRAPVFDLAWRLYNGDVNALRQRFGDSPAARAQLATHLIGRKRIEDALSLWDSLSAADKRKEQGIGQALMSAMLEAKHYRAALELLRSFTPPDAALPQVGQIKNAGFEDDISLAGAGAVTNTFDWRIQPALQAQIAVDARTHHSGGRSLRVTFNAPSNVAFTDIAQLVVVEPSTRYRFQASVMIRDLKSAGTPIIEILNAADNSVLAASSPLPNGTGEWQQVAIDFTTGAKTEGVSIRTNRASCGAGEATCPIFGTVWYDDFNLQRIGGNSGNSVAKH